MHTIDGQVGVLVSQDHWDKSKWLLDWIQGQLGNPEGILLKELESHRDFLIYISCTYLATVLYLKGLHLTLDSWRLWRWENGWRMTMSEMPGCAGKRRRQIDDGKHSR